MCSILINLGAELTNDISNQLGTKLRVNVILFFPVCLLMWFISNLMNMTRNESVSFASEPTNNCNKNVFKLNICKS